MAANKRWLACLACALPGLALSDPAPWWLGVEAGLYKPERNRVQIPNDELGDRFDISDLGNDFFPAARITLGWQPEHGHELQLIYAPFVYTERGQFDKTIRFDSATFAGGTDVEARYQFSNYRLRYLYRWLEDGRWQADVGGTLFVRDASVRLSNDFVASEDSNVGVVPLLAFRAAYGFGGRWSAWLDTDLAIAPQGRAIDLSLMARYDLSDTLAFAAGYRTIEGGADNDDVFSFAWFNGVTGRVEYSW